MEGVEFLVSWETPSGDEAHRTIRVRLRDEETVGDIRARGRAEAARMFSGHGMYGNDTIGLGPANPDDFDLTITAII